MDIIDQYLGLWGVDVAVKKLRPHAKFEITNTTFTKWDDPTGDTTTYLGRNKQTNRKR
jgi:hypothetical protein